MTALEALKVIKDSIQWRIYKHQPDFGFLKMASILTGKSEEDIKDRIYIRTLAFDSVIRDIDKLINKLNNEEVTNA